MSADRRPVGESGVAGEGVFAGVAGLWAAPAQAISYSPERLGFTGLDWPVSIAVSGSGDVFVVNNGTSFVGVMELSADGTCRSSDRPSS